MGRKAGIIKSDEEYIKSEVWKCNQSPTGAHYWIQLTQTLELYKSGYFTCKYCHDVRKFPTDWSQINGVRGLVSYRDFE